MNSWTTLMTVCALTLLVSACDKKTDTPQAEANSAEVKPGDGVVDAGKPVDTPAKAADERKPGMFYVDPGAAQPALVTKAVAVMHGLGDNDVKGTVMFEAVDGGGMKVSADITGLPKDSTHAYHFHVFGDCTSDDGKSAGTHFHFDGSSMNPPKDIKVITGNLGEPQGRRRGQGRGERDDQGRLTAGVLLCAGARGHHPREGQRPQRPAHRCSRWTTRLRRGGRGQSVRIAPASPRDAHPSPHVRGLARAPGAQGQSAALAS